MVSIFWLACIGVGMWAFIKAGNGFSRWLYAEAEARRYMRLLKRGGTSQAEQDAVICAELERMLADV